LLPRRWNFSIFIVNILIMHITKKLLKCRADVGSCKNFLLRAVAGLRSCKKKSEGTLSHFTRKYNERILRSVPERINRKNL
jgi:hypothetical protein